MDADIINVLIKDGGKNLAVAEEISSKIDAAKKVLFDRNIMSKIRKTIAELGRYKAVEFKDWFNKERIRDTDKDRGLQIIIQDSKWEVKDICIWFEIYFRSLNTSLCGIGTRNTETSEVSSSICKSIRENPKRKPDEEQDLVDEWLLKGNMTGDYSNWKTDTLVRIASDPTDFCNVVKERVGHYASIIDEALKSTN